MPFVYLWENTVNIQNKGVTFWDIQSLKGHLDAYSSLQQGIIPHQTTAEFILAR